MTDAETTSLLLIGVAAMLAFGVRAMWGRRTPQPSAKNNWRRTGETKAGRGFDDVGAGGDPLADGAD